MRLVGIVGGGGLAIEVESVFDALSRLEGLARGRRC
jgi:hypothetical protein